jgi:hypothetical protein
MITFSNTKHTTSYPNSSVIHLPTSDYLLNIYSTYDYNNLFLYDKSNLTQSNIKKR